MVERMKIAVLVSGGVDSSVALKLLKDQGHEVTAFYLKIWLEDELAYLGDCPWEQDLNYVRRVCEQLNVPLEVIPLQKEYHDKVVTYTIAHVKAGRTPNPDVLCNKHIKFGLFFEHISDSYEKIASGHYAQVKKLSDGTMQLVSAPDAIKDQTYFLSYLTQEQLKRIIFPIGHLTKEQVRDLAHGFDLPNKERKDSQGICFLGEFKFRDFVRAYLGENPGKIIEFETNRRVGEHKGFWFYTIGQRQGIGLSGGPWYVVHKDIEQNIVYVSRHYYASDKQRDTFTIERCNWISGQQPEQRNVQMKLRHGPRMYNAVLTQLNDNQLHVQLDERDQGIASGQFAVLYDGSVCLGGGIIV
jgi:tRNA (5-methylaminomethyl-2-thiouridylate)-methyltransferase